MLSTEPMRITPRRPSARTWRNHDRIRKIDRWNDKSCGY